MRRSVGAAAPPVHAQGFDSSAGQQLDSSTARQLDSSTARRISSSPGRKSRFFVPASQPSLFGRCARDFSVPKRGERFSMVAGLA